jgi:hypothetical protein
VPNYARFDIDTSPASDGGFDALESTTLELKLPATPGNIVQRTTFEVYDPLEPTAPLASKDAPLIELDNGITTAARIDAATPHAIVEMPIPAGVHSWRVRCLVNGGQDANGRTHPDFMFERLVVVRSAGGLRKIVHGEGTSYGQRGDADAQNEMVDAGGGGGGSGDVTHPGASVTARIPVYASDDAGPGAELADSGFTIADLQATIGAGTAIGTLVAASRNLASGDAGKLTECTHASTPIVITVQPNSVVALPVGHTSHWFQGGAAQVSFAEVAPAVIVKSQSLKLASLGCSFTLIKVATDRFLLIGETELA